MFGYIYKTTDLRNSKIYIGQHKSSKFDTTYYGSGVIIANLLKSNPIENFKCEIICECYSQEDMNEKEIYWISKYDSRNPQIGYNIASGGSFGDSGYHLGMLGKHQSDKQKEAAHKASSYKRNSATRAKMSKAKIGNTNGRGNKGKEGAFKGRHHTQETKDLLSCTMSNIVKDYHKNLTKEQKIQRSSNISKSKSGCICITNGEKNFYIQPSSINNYVDKGYYKMSCIKYHKLIKEKQGELLETLYIR